MKRSPDSHHDCGPLSMSLHETRFPVNPPGLIVIPARLESRRLPRKLLLAETGRSLLGYSIEIARRAVAAAPELLSGPVVAADAEELLAISREAGVSSLLTDADHLNGTSRIGEVLRRFPSSSFPSFVVNLQADHPELDAEVLVGVAETLLQDPECEMATAAVALDASDLGSFANPHMVKVACDSDLLARRFFRVLPAQELVATPCYRHLGVYAYRTDFLVKIVEASPSPDALREDLEQLTALGLGARIRVAIVSASSAGYGIDTPADYAAFVRRLSCLSDKGNPGEEC